MTKATSSSEKESWTSEHLYFDGDSYFAAVEKAIAEAKTSLLVETYIYDPDILGERIEQALTRASHRGVYVRLLVDGIGAARWIDRNHDAFNATGARFRVYHPIAFSKVASAFLSNFGFRKHESAKSFFSRLNRRDHRKVIVVDEKVAFVGSLNISMVHCQSLVHEKAWRDTGVRVEGDAIRDLIIAFDSAWIRSHGSNGKRRWSESLLAPFQPLKTRPFSPLVRLNYTRSLRRRNARDFKTRLLTSTTRVWLTNAYLAPSAPLVREISAAAERGVDVRLLVPQKSDVFFMPWVAASHYAPLLKSGVRIFEYLPRFLHAKSVMIDDWSTVGTSNMNRRSALYDYEVDLVLTNPESTRCLEEQFHLDCSTAEEIRQARGGITAFLGRLFAVVFKRYI